MRVKNIISIILVGVMIFWSGCGGDDPVNVQKGTQLAKTIHQTGGFGMGPESNSGINSNPAILNNDIMNIIDEHDYFNQTSIDNFNIYVDMSAGLSPQILAAEDELRAVVQSFSNATFFGIGGRTGNLGNDDPKTYQPEDLTQKIKDAEKTPISYLCVGGKAAAETYNHNNSFLKSAVNSCVYTDKESKSINPNATLFISDFLLDEGGKSQSWGTKYGSATAANPTGWATEQFKDWFAAGNRLDIIAKKTTLVNGQYGSNGHVSNDKYLYFIFFTPKKDFKNEKISRLLEELGQMNDVNHLRIDPSSYSIELTNNNGPGNNLTYNYPDVKKRNQDIYNVVIDGQQLNDKYQVQFLPFSISMLKKVKEQDNGTPPFKNFDLINNFNLQDRNDSESCPYKIKIGANFYQATDFIYQLSGIDMARLDQVPHMSFDPNTYPGNLVDENGMPLKHPRLMTKETNIFNFTDSTIQLTAQALNASEAMHAVDPAKIYLCDIVADRVSFNKEDYYNYEFLEWKHLSFNNHQVNVKCLKESINHALRDLKGTHEGTVIYSYLIGINK